MKRYTIAALLFFTVVSILIFREPLFNGDPHSIELVGDLAVPTNLDNFIQDYFPTWSDQFSKSNLIMVSRYVVYLPLFGIARLFSIHPMTLVEVFWVITGIIAGFGAYLAAFSLLRREFKNTSINIIFAASLLAGFFYLWNPFFAKESRHMLIRFSYALLPLVVLACVIALEKVKFRYLCLTAVAWVFIASGPRWSIFGGIILLLALIYVVVYHRVFTIKGVARLVGKAAIIGIIFAILSSFWVVPTIFSSPVTGIEPDYVVSADKIQRVSPYNFTDIFLFNLRNEFLPNRPHAFNPEISTITSMGIFFTLLKILLPVIAFGILIFRRSVHTLFFTGVALVFMLVLAAGSNNVLWNIYQWWVLKAPWADTLGWVLRATFYLFPFYMFSFTMLLGIATTWILTKLFRKTLIRELATGLVIALTLTAVVFTSWPLLTGDFNGELEPVKLPETYFSANQWLAGEDGGKAVWFPKYEVTNTTWRQGRLTKWIGDLSSALPTYFVSLSGSNRRPNAIFFEFISSIHARWKTDVLQSRKTDEVGQLLAPLNVEYIAFHNDIVQTKARVENALNALHFQSDLAPVFQDDFIHIFQNEAPVAGLFNIPPLTVLAEGGLEILPALNALDSLDLIDAALIFGEVDLNQAIPGSPDIILTRPDAGFHIQNQPGLILLKPFQNCIRHNPSQVWSRYNTSEPGGGSWRRYLESRGIDNWEFDYGKGFVFTWNQSPGNTLKMRFRVEEAGAYQLYIRYLRNKKGGHIGVSVDSGLNYTVESKDRIDGYIWERIDTIALSKGSHEVTLTNLAGFNAVNLLALVPATGMEPNAPVYQEANYIVYLMEGEADLYSDNATIRHNYGVKASNGKVLVVKKGGKAWVQLNIVRDGTYSLAVRYGRRKRLENLKVRIDEDTYYDMALEKGEGLTWAFLDNIELTRGTHSLTLECPRPTPIDLVVLYSSDNGETLADVFAAEPKAELIGYKKLSATKYIVHINATEPFVLSFAESYDPLWAAYLDGQRIDPLPLYGVINGFPIEKTGNLGLIIEYEPQKWFVWGSVISVFGLSICFALAYIEWKKDRNVSTNIQQ